MTEHSIEWIIDVAKILFVIGIIAVLLLGGKAMTDVSQVKEDVEILNNNMVAFATNQAQFNEAVATAITSQTSQPTQPLPQQ